MSPDIKDDKELVGKMLGVAKSNSRFDRVVSTITTSFVMKVIVPLVESMFSKYSEEYFHQRMTEGVPQ